MKNLRLEDIINVYNTLISKRVKNKKRLYDFELYKMENICIVYDIFQTGKYPDIKYNIFLIKDLSIE